MSCSGPQHRIPGSLSVTGLRESGFEGGIPIRELRRACIRATAAEFPVPRVPGVYLVVRQGRRKACFLRRNCGGAFKGRDPTLPRAALDNRWVADAPILYIGKAGGSGQRTTLHSRLLSYIRFGLGRPTAHWGGRCIWQLTDASALLIYWKPLRKGEPRTIEKRLIATFVAHHGRRPFANLTG